MSTITIGGNTYDLDKMYKKIERYKEVVSAVSFDDYKSEKKRSMVVSVVDDMLDIIDDIKYAINNHDKNFAEVQTIGLVNKYEMFMKLIKD